MFWTCHDLLPLYLLLEIKVSGRSVRRIPALVHHFVSFRWAMQRRRHREASDAPYPAPPESLRDLRILAQEVTSGISVPIRLFF